MYRNWHSHSTSKVLKQLGTSKKGLTSAAATRRYKKDGPNVLPRKKQLSKVKLLWRQFNNALMLILLSTVAISFVLGHASDAAFILIVILINIFVGFYQENKANNSLRVLQKMVRIKVRVLRNGLLKEVDSEALVRGDIIVLGPGDKVPADCRIVEAKGLKINEASLTGEWLAVEKREEELPVGATISDQCNMLFMGTSVEVGESLAVVVKTGVETEFGRIVTLVKETDEPQTPLQRKISRLSKIVGVFVIGLVAIIIVEGYFTGKDIVEIFIAAMALAVSSIPEGLLPAITIILVLAMRRILKQKGVVKKLSAAEGLGSVTVVCSDKTGTLTEGNMQMSHLTTGVENLLPKKSELASRERQPGQRGSDEMAITIATLTNDAYIENPGDELHKWVIRGYFTDKALLLSGVQSGVDIQGLEKEFSLIEKQSFSSHKRYALSLRSKDSKKYLFVVGAPEELISRSSKIYENGLQVDLNDEDRKDLKNDMDEFTSKGLRVISCAFREIEGEVPEDLNSLVESLSFVGLMSLRDPIRKDAKQAIQEIQTAGVRPIIITGDHRQTAAAVAREVGLSVGKDQILEGKDIESMSSAQLTKKVRTVAVFARALPEHKLKIIKALHQNNEVVAMFGDGVNDAPALKAADIGVAVGSGTDVAKEVADIILLEDNFRTIVKAIEQGRIAFSNIRKVFMYLVADDFTEIILFLGAMAFGLPLPLLAAQILWINLIEDSAPNIALTMEQETKGVMEEPPRDPNEPILSTEIKKYMLAILLINGLITFFFFWFLHEKLQDIDKTRTIIFTLMSFDSLAFAYSMRSFKKTIFRKDIFSNKYLNWAVAFSFTLLVCSVYVPKIQGFLGTVAMSPGDWVPVVLITIFEIIVIDVARRIFFKKKKA